MHLVRSSCTDGTAERPAPYLPSIEGVNDDAGYFCSIERLME